MSDFGIQITPNGVMATVNESKEEADIVEMLRFDAEDIETLLRTQSSTQAYWEALTVRLKTRYERFKEGWMKKWWAHNKRFAKYVLTSYGESKPTVDSIIDTTVILYSADTTQNERNKYGTTAFGVASTKKLYESEEEFVKSMYKYLYFDPPWYYETLMDTAHSLREGLELVQITAERLHSRSFHLDLYARMLRAKKSNVEPLDERRLIENMESRRNG